MASDKDYKIYNVDMNIKKTILPDIQAPLDSISYLLYNYIVPFQ